MLSWEEYKSEKELAEKLDFVMNDFSVSSYEEASRLCNGIGAEWMNPAIRVALGKLHPSLKPVADNHDLNFSHADGSRKMFLDANEAFKINGFKVARHNYGALDPRRYWVIHKASQFKVILDTFGWPAYCQACMTRP